MPNKKIEALYAETGLTPNMEDYMEAIACLVEKNRVVRVKDIAKILNIKMPSVTAALNKLKTLNLIEYEKYGFVELTEKGRETAHNVCRKHKCLTEFFSGMLGIDTTVADREACRVEHHLAPETCRQLHKLIEFYSSEKKMSKQWTKELDELLSA